MSETYKIKGIANFARAIKARMRKMQKDGTAGCMRAAKKSVPIVRKRTPKAFGELQESVQAYPRNANGNIVLAVDAPHAGAVEKGSPPHTPNFDRLLAWVRLRGMQGLTKGGNIKRRFAKGLGHTTPRQATHIATLIRSARVRGRGGKKGWGRYTPVGTPEAIAEAISRKIEKEGTKPHWYVLSSLPEIGELTRKELSKLIGSPNLGSSRTDWLIGPGTFEKLAKNAE